jgi:UDP-N-acetylmuramoyl-L-alanyl-D-glutamate--2,6-diaminopimelate ligase
LAGFVDDGRTAAVLEVSSHALALHRVDGTEFDAVVFTNLGRDHLDLHGTSEEYFRAKARLFGPSFAPLGVINVDDPHGRVLADAAASSDPARPFRVVPFSVEDLTDVVVEADRHRFTWRGTVFEVPLGGRFNVSNSLAAVTTAIEVGIDPEVAREGLAHVSPIPGRFEVITSPGTGGPFTLIVDYAHTPDGLAELLATSAGLTGDNGQVTAVFGCGGERDADKRAEMGAVAVSGADRVIVTSDNPRREDPMAIVTQILAGTGESTAVTVLIDRREAIRHAVSTGRAGDVIVIAGKGHERTQDLGGKVVDFDDRAVARELLEDPT